MALAFLPMPTSDPTPPPPDLVEAWSTSAQTVLDLGHELGEEDLGRDTDLPGWTVQDILAHLAALDSELAGEAPAAIDTSAIPSEAVGDPFRAHTEMGVSVRRGRSAAEVLTELAEAVRRLRVLLAADDPPPPPSSFPRRGGWTAVLSDRTLDYWMHEQDVRRAVGRPGGWDTPGAGVTISAFLAALPFVVGRKVRPATGTTVAWAVAGPSGTTEVTIRMDGDGRARPVRTADADVALSMSLEDFVLACGGRRETDELSVRMDGDTDLGLAVLANMAVTP